MTEEVLIELMSDPPPQGSLDLSPLGKTLVVALLNEDVYKKDKEAGRHLSPVQASSTVTAAYWYMPMVKLPLQSKYTFKLRGKEEEIDLPKLLPGKVTEQEVHYWIGCESDEDLVDHFTPNAITDRMQPANDGEKNDQLGILTRLRVANGAYKDLITKLDGGLKWDGKQFWKENEKKEKYDIVDNPIDLLDKEKTRLTKKLKNARDALKKALESYEITIEGGTVSIKNQALDRDLYNIMGEAIPEQAVQQYGKFLELKRHYDRLVYVSRKEANQEVAKDKAEKAKAAAEEAANAKKAADTAANAKKAADTTAANAKKTANTAADEAVKAKKAADEAVKAKKAADEALQEAASEEAKATATKAAKAAATKADQAKAAAEIAEKEAAEANAAAEIAEKKAAEANAAAEIAEKKVAEANAAADAD